VGRVKVRVPRVTVNTMRIEPFPPYQPCCGRLVVRVTLIVRVRRADKPLREACMLLALPGQYPAVLREERLDPYGTRKYWHHTGDGINRMPSAIDKM